MLRPEKRCLCPFVAPMKLSWLHALKSICLLLYQAHRPLGRRPVSTATKNLMLLQAESAQNAKMTCITVPVHVR